MSDKLIKGSFVALVTPFNKDGSVDYVAFKELIAFQARNQTSAILIMGSTGEVSMLSHEERLAIIEQVVEFKTGAMKFFFGCTGTHTAATIDYVRHAKASGADGAIIAAPAYICASENDIESYLLEIADATDLPLGFYNNPPRVKTDLTAATLLRVFKHPNFVVHKESTGRVGQVAQILAQRPDVSIMCCDSPNLGLVVPTMSLGGQGTANMTGNIAPSEMAILSQPWQTGDDAIAFRENYLRLLPLLHYAYSAINPVAIKSLMKAVGLPVGELRRPLRLLEGEALTVGLKALQALELDKKYDFKISYPR